MAEKTYDTNKLVRVATEFISIELAADEDSTYRLKSAFAPDYIEISVANTTGHNNGYIMDCQSNLLPGVDNTIAVINGTNTYSQGAVWSNVKSNAREPFNGQQYWFRVYRASNRERLTAGTFILTIKLYRYE